MRPDGSGFERRHLDRKTPWRLVKKYCEAAGIDPSRLGSRGIGIHSLRTTAINDAIRNGATMHEVREFAGHADIRTTELYIERKEEDAEVAALRIQIRLTGSRLQEPVNPLAVVPEIPTAQPGVLHDVTSEATPIVYGMWMRMLLVCYGRRTFQSRSLYRLVLQ